MLPVIDTIGPKALQYAATLLVNELLPRLKKKGLKIEDSPVSPEDMATLAIGKYMGLLTTKDIRQVLDKKFE